MHYPFQNLNNQSLIKDLIRRGTGRFFGDSAQKTHAEKVLGSGDARVFDLTLCMFGVIAYATNEKERIAVLETLNQLTTDSVFITYPTQKFVRGTTAKIVAEDTETGVVTYETVGGQLLEYMLFGGSDYTRAGARNEGRLELEIGRMLTGGKEGIAHFSMTPLFCFSAAHVVSKSLADYAAELENSQDVLKNFPPAYKFAIFHPDSQRVYNSSPTR